PLGLTSPVRAKQVLINSYYGPNRNPNNNSSNGSTSHLQHVKRHSMPTINLENIIDQSSIQSSTMQQPLLQSKPINIVAQQNANYNYEQQQQELFKQQNNAATINNSQHRQHIQHHRSMPLLNADLTITPESKPPGYSSIFQRNPNYSTATSTSPPSSGQNISGSYGSRSFSLPPVINNFANLKKSSNSTIQYRQPSLYSASTTIPIHSPDDHFNRTPPLLHQHNNGSHKLHNSGNNSLFVSSNPPTPVDLPMVPTVHPSTSQYHSLVGNNGNISNSNNGRNSKSLIRELAIRPVIIS
ncbi:13487_t:CDS:2, partial [Ambispora leptoticha]